MDQYGLTVIILTWDEERHLPDCLDSARQLTQDILVLDSGSTDTTRDIACSSGARVVQRPFDGFASQRNAALQMSATRRWVFFLDADERVTARLADEIKRQVTKAGPELAGFWIPRRNILFGRALGGGGWWPDYQARLMRPDRARYDPDRQVHEVVSFDGDASYLRSPLIHLSYTSRREFIARQRRYTEQRIHQAHRNGFRPRRRAYISGPIREFWRRLIRLSGYRDGVTGLFLGAVLAFEEVRFCWRLRNGARNP